MAYCLVPEVDVAHVHDSKSGQTALLLKLTRAVPYVITSTESGNDKQSIWGSVWDRASATVEPDDLHPDSLLESYRRALGAISERPENADSRQ